MTLGEINNAVEGFDEHRNEEFQQDLIIGRLISFYANYPHVKGVKKPQDLFDLEIDKVWKTEQHKKIKPIEVIRE
jgi:hypothetical protein